MLLDAIVLTVVGAVAALLPFSAAYRSHLTRRLARQAGTPVPADQTHALEARMARRAWGVGGGVALAGLLLLGWALLGPGRGEDSTGSYLVLSAMFVFGAGGLAVVEILRPGPPVDGPRTARASAPGLADYLPALVRVLVPLFIALGMVVLLTALALSWSPWFDADTIRRSPLPLLAAAIPVLSLLSVLAVRAVLAAPQPARNEVDLFWQDLVRASTLSSVVFPPALVAVFALVVCGSVLDDAASVAAQAQGQVGPGWSLWLLVAGYVVPLLLAFGALAATLRWGGNEMQHTRSRLWGGRMVGTAAGAGGA